MSARLYNPGGFNSCEQPDDPRISHANSRVTDVGTGESNHPSLTTQCQSNVILPQNNNDALFRSVVGTWIPDHQLSASIHIRPDRHTAATNGGSSPHQGNISISNQTAAQ
ncbi:hypothetical protein F4823DRAFT_331372 [Ustulina deusta]|nr:hypothetical protein F4823DRAFT_331372 [Ustulina deusta]